MLVVEKSSVARIHNTQDQRKIRTIGSETLLLVEDEPQVRAVEAQALRAQGYQVLEASNGADAQRVAQESAGEIHLLISDIVMPQMGGRDLAEWMRARYPTTRILLTSGYTDTMVAHQGGDDSMTTAFLQKPFSPRDLVQKVQEVLAG